MPLTHARLILITIIFSCCLGQAGEIDDLLLKDTASKFNDCAKAVKTLNATCETIAPMITRPSSSLRNMSHTSFAAANGKTEDVSLLTKEQAQEAFDLLKSSQTTLRWDIPDLCAQKAQKGSIILENKGVIVGKIFATPPAFGSLNPKISPTGVQWDYHVAPFVFIKEGDKTQQFVLDPLLGSGPIPVEKWKSLVDTNPIRVTFQNSSRFVYEPKRLYDNITTYNPEETKAASKALMNANSLKKARSNP